MFEKIHTGCGCGQCTGRVWRDEVSLNLQEYKKHYYWRDKEECEKRHTKGRREASYHRVYKYKQIARRKQHKSKRVKYRKQIADYMKGTIEDIGVINIPLGYTD